IAFDVRALRGIVARGEISGEGVDFRLQRVDERRIAIELLLQRLHAAAPVRLILGLLFVLRVLVGRGLVVRRGRRPGGRAVRGRRGWPGRRGAQILVRIDLGGFGYFFPTLLLFLGEVAE